MALDKDSMANKIKAKLEALGDWPGPGMNITITELRFIIAVCEGIIEEFVQNGVVLPDTLNNPAGQPVVAGGQPGATTAAQTIAGTGKII